MPSSVDWVIETTRGWAWCSSPRAAPSACDVVGARACRAAVATVSSLTAGDALGRAALVDVHVGDVGADHRLERAGQRVERGDVGAGAVEDAEGARVGRRSGRAKSASARSVHGSAP